ncbi:hypothetical protein TEQG_02080 [Trichophyton equinum CBS 127.97]|uniref:Uncharacterized protein n=1 Tax=Trichophyton equinum (strain ATCC MYA-4606 / CBS 127.97) TaxID=559882 RepID=F2PME6_TRIEC|nr:hypothetical protein TEQG_02080 [Trichophyton equinum CBS 127.97]
MKLAQHQKLDIKSPPAEEASLVSHAKSGDIEVLTLRERGREREREGGGGGGWPTGTVVCGCGRADDEEEEEGIIGIGIFVFESPVSMTGWRLSGLFAPVWKESE